MIETRLIVDANNHLGEGPLWDVKEQRLYWIDSTAAEISSCRADGSDMRRYFVPRHIGSMALREQRRRRGRACERPAFLRLRRADGQAHCRPGKRRSRDAFQRRQGGPARAVYRRDDGL